MNIGHVTFVCCLSLIFWVVSRETEADWPSWVLLGLLVSLIVSMLLSLCEKDDGNDAGGNDGDAGGNDRDDAGGPVGFDQVDSAMQVAERSRGAEALVF